MLMEGNEGTFCHLEQQGLREMTQTSLDKVLLDSPIML